MPQQQQDDFRNRDLAVVVSPPLPTFPTDRETGPALANLDKTNETLSDNNASFKMLNLDVVAGARSSRLLQKSEKLDMTSVSNKSN